VPGKILLWSNVNLMTSPLGGGSSARTGEANTTIGRRNVRPRRVHGVNMGGSLVVGVRVLRKNINEIV
jgi:hypothetical protein